MTSLLDLPPELLHNIYDWLRLIEAAKPRPKPGPRFTCQPVSRALLPYTQAYRFHTVTLRDRSQLAMFAAVVGSSAVLGPLVRELNVFEPCTGPKRPYTPVDGGSLNEMWHRLGLVRAVMFSGPDEAIEGMLDAAGEGVRLAKLETAYMSCEYELWTDPYNLDKWRPFLEQAPVLKKLEFAIDSYHSPLYRLSSPPATPSAPFRTAVATLELSNFPVAHDAALANFANAFPALESLHVRCISDSARPGILPLLRLPTLRALSFDWWADDPSGDAPLPSLDLRSFSGLEEFTLGEAPTEPDFCFHLPPSVHTLRLTPGNLVPLAALQALVTPSTPRHHPALKRIHLDLAYAGSLEGQSTEGMSAFELAELDLTGDDWMRWSDEVSEEGLRDLICAAEEHGVELAGNCKGVFDFEEAMRKLLDQRRL